MISYFVEAMEFIVYAPGNMTYGYNNGFRDYPEIIDWLEELPPREDDGGASCSIGMAGSYIYFAREEDELAFRLKFDIW